MPFATVTAVTLLIFLVQVAAGFSSAFSVLYVVPVWMAVRGAGNCGGWLAVAAVTSLITLEEFLRESPPGVGLLAAFCARFCCFGIVMTLLSWFESRHQEVKQAAFRDPLTGVFNRRVLEEVMQNRPSFFALPRTVVVVDCDRFKAINDRYGHQAGDAILSVLARILQTETRTEDLVIRMGGDEFALLLSRTTQSEARRVMARIKEDFQNKVSDAGYDCSISVGIAGVDDSEDLETLLKQADKAMYSEKRLSFSRDPRASME
jgi:diguanylate cyclase (GGDEF)-like protein